MLECTGESNEERIGGLVVALVGSGDLNGIALVRESEDVAQEFLGQRDAAVLDQVGRVGLGVEAGRDEECVGALLRQFEPSQFELGV